MAVAIISQAVRDGGRVRDRQIRRKKTERTWRRKDKGEITEEREGKQERDVHHTVSVTLFSTTSIMIPDSKVTPYRQRYTIFKMSLTVL